MKQLKRPLRDNLLRQLELAKQHRDKLYQLQRESGEAGIELDVSTQIRRAEQDVDKLERLTR